MTALLIFHIKAGVQIAVRSFAILFSSILAVIMLDINPAGVVINLARAVFAHRPATSDLAPIVALAFLFPALAVKKLALGLNGWIRHLAFDHVGNRRGMAVALATVQMPLAVALASLAFVAGSHGLSIGYPAIRLFLVLMSGALASLPVDRRYVMVPVSMVSALLKLASGIERPDHGIAEIEGHDLWKDEVAARRALAYVSEQPDLTPYATIRDVINLVCRLRSQPLQQGRDVLERVGLWQIANRSIRELSSGQRRRAVLAAAWIGSPRVVLLDEPLEAMDRTIRAEICAWIERLLSEEAAVVIATHEIEPFLEKAARALLVSGGACMLYEPLPPDAQSKQAYLEMLSRGTLPVRRTESRL